MRALSSLAALTIVVAAGVVQGLWTGRWSRSDELAVRAAGLERVPLTIGDWRGRALALDPRMAERAELAGYLMRRYESRGGDAVTVLLVCGRPGPIAAHTPEVCYGGAGYEPSARVKLALEGGAASLPDGLWALDLAKQGTVAVESLRILYAWTTDGSWRASRSPRTDFAGSPVLYKLYIVRQMTGADEPVRGDPGARFARRFLPALRESLFSAP